MNFGRQNVVQRNANKTSSFCDPTLGPYGNAAEIKKMIETINTLDNVVVKYPQIVQIMEDAAIAAGQQIMGIYANDDIPVDWKADDSPLTQADVRAHHVIIDHLSKHLPGIQIISEEDETNTGVVFDNIFFLVDPLDGTKEFIKRTGEFTVNIGLIIQGVAKLGAVYLPVQDKLYASAGEGCAIVVRSASKTCNIRQSEKITVRKVPTEGPTLVMSASHGSDETHDYCSLYKPTATLSAGSSLKFCKVAEGKADYYPRLGRTMEWDTAAAHAVLKSAGGNVFSLKDGEELRYGKPGVDNSYFVATASFNDVIKTNLDWRR
ncbi:3'(2'),5'-bisphosphate nucleotidase CysQ [Planktomarina temperata]|nr:3'(2'),5'-bisphosphate nucleotidase CysQ [Planktomarina temperata]